MRGLGRAELESILEVARNYASGTGFERVMDARTVALLFFERSTRTRLSFQLAAERLGAHVLNLDPSRSSTGKGESLRDTVMTVAAIGADVLVVRHEEAGIPDLVAEWTGLSVVNAGDGMREHPTQALVDLLTLQSHFGELSGLRVGIIGDISHSRVAGSLTQAMPAMGIDLILIGPESFLPQQITDLDRATDLDGVIGELDVVYLLRVQTERGAEVDSSYRQRYGLDSRRAAAMRENAVIMHPGPINRGVEISDEVADGPRSLILDQVANGVPVRMAVLAALESALA